MVSAGVCQVQERSRYNGIVRGGSVESHAPHRPAVCSDSEVCNGRIVMERASEGGSFTLDVQSTTGGSFTLNLDRAVTVDQLKKLVSRRLKLSKDRICLLHRERQLREGTLEENGLADGARVILLPSVETGLLSQRTENSVMQALESLNDTQVNDFLSGKSPLNLTMRLGDHTMLIQLQLSTLNPSSSCSSRRSVATETATSTARTRRDTPETPKKSTPSTSQATSPASRSPKSKEFDEKQRKQDCSIQQAFDLVRSLAEIKDLDKLGELIDSETESASTSETPSTSQQYTDEQSPIKSLSNLASSPLKADTLTDVEKSPALDLEYVPLPGDPFAPLTTCLSEGMIGASSFLPMVEEESSDFTDPIAANLTSCLCSTLNPGFPCDSECQPSGSKAEPALGDDVEMSEEQGSFLTESTLDEYPMENFFNNAVDQGLFEDTEEVSVDREISNLARTAHSCETAVAEPLPSFQSLTDTNKNKRLHYLLHKTSKYKHPISQNKQKAFMQSVVNKHIKRSIIRHDAAVNSHSQPSTSRTEPFITSPRKLTLLQTSESSLEGSPQPSTSRQSPKLFRVPDTPKLKSQPSTSALTLPDTKALLEASKNLTQTLKKLSKEVLISKIDKGETEETLRTKTGAVIESMKHHGKGIYSGTFSGTLNPALQDRFGRPKRDISTIIHILNDLLCATPPFAATPKEPKRTASSSGTHKGECACGGCSAPCAYGQCDGHPPAPSGAPSAAGASAAGGAAGAACAGCGERALCQRCDTAKALAIENSKTKCKVEQLRLVMQQKKQRREARKLQAAPYAKPPAPPPQSPPRAERIDSVA